MSNKKFKVGDKVRYIGKDHLDCPEYYPAIGTVGTITGTFDNDPDCYIQWPKNSTSGNDEHWCSKDDIELVEDVDMTNEEIWKMVESKMSKNGLSGYVFSIPTLESIEGDIKWVEEQTYKANDVHNAIALAYKVGYLRAMKGRPFKIGEKKKKSGHWEPIDPNNLPKEGTKVRYKGGLKGCNWEQNSTAKWIKNEKDRFSIKFDGTSWTLDCINCLLKYFDMWVEDNE